MGKVYVIIACPTLTTRRFSYFLSQVRGIASLRPKHNGDAVDVAAHVFYCAVWKFQCRKSLMRLSPDPFPIFEGGVRLKPGSQYIAQLRGAARRGAVLATICEHSTAHESRRAAKIDPSSKFAARCGAADAARPIK